MNIVITILLVIAGFIALLLILALFAKKEYTIWREVSIDRTPGDVFNYIKLLKNQDHYNKWVMVDPDKKKEFRGIDGTVGFVYAWDGNSKAGAGEQEIKMIADGERIDSEIRFQRPFKAVSDATMIIVPTANGSRQQAKTEVKWIFSGKLKYPMNLMHAFMQKMLSKDMEISLGNLKGILEK